MIDTFQPRYFSKEKYWLTNDLLKMIPYMNPYYLFYEIETMNRKIFSILINKIYILM